jgi:SET domain-containing protein
MFKNRGKFTSLKELKLIKKAERIHNDYYNSSSFELYIDDSQIKDAGLGVFTDEDILENTIIDEYRGELIESFESVDNPYYYEIIEPNKENNQLGIGVDASKLPRCYTAMINDASFEKDLQNNCEFQDDIEKKTVYVVTIRDIKAGEELFVSYGDNYWRPSFTKQINGDSYWNKKPLSIITAELD